MRRPMLLAVLLVFALGAVIYGKYMLDRAIKEGRFEDKPAAAADDQPHTIDLGVQSDPNKPAPQEMAPHSSGNDHQDVMAALVEARSSFKNKEQVTAQASADPHGTPNAIVRSAEKLGAVVTLEEKHPEYKPEFQAFYLDCSKDPDVITVTRVQCLERYIKSKGVTGDEERKLLAEVDPVVKKLYLEIK